MNGKPLLHQISASAVRDICPGPAAGAVWPGRQPGPGGQPRGVLLLLVLSMLSLFMVLGIMFVAFLLQIVFRYFFNFPIGWSSELSVITWLYMTLLGSAYLQKMLMRRSTSCEPAGRRSERERVGGPKPRAF